MDTTWSYLNLILPTGVILYPCVWFIKIGETSIINLKLSLHIKVFGAAAGDLNLFLKYFRSKISKQYQKSLQNQITLFLLLQKARRTYTLVRRTFTQSTHRPPYLSPSTTHLLQSITFFVNITNPFIKNQKESSFSPSFEINPLGKNNTAVLTLKYAAHCHYTQVRRTLYSVRRTHLLRKRNLSN